jgi:predicted transcriptional regulator
VTRDFGPESDLKNLRPKQRIAKSLAEAIDSLPDDACAGEVLDTVEYMYKIERGLADIEAGRTVSHEEAIARMKKWGK